MVWGELLVTLKSILHCYNLFEKRKRKKKGEKGPKLSKELWLVVIKKRRGTWLYIRGSVQVAHHVPHTQVSSELSLIEKINKLIKINK